MYVILVCCLTDNSTFVRGGFRLPLRTLRMASEVTGWASAVERIRPGQAGATLTGW